MAYSRARRLAQLLSSDGTVVSGKIPADAIDGTKIADDAIDSEHYTDGSVDLAHITGGLIQLSSESFVDNDTSLMTSAAIQDKILSYGYTTETGDITSVVAGTGLSGGGSSGDVTLNIGQAVGTSDNVSFGTITGSTSVKTPLIEYTDGDDALTIADGGHLTTGGNLTVTGNLQVDGTTTTVNSTTLTVDDKNIELGSVASPSDTTADGGGITLKGASDKTILWTNSTDSWDFNQSIKVTGTLGVTGIISPTTHIDMPDNARIRLGAQPDLQIFHNGTDSYVQDTGLGSLMLAGSAVFITNADASETMIRGVADGAVTLYHNSAAKLDTASGGITVTGTLTPSGQILAPAGSASAPSYAFGAQASTGMYKPGTSQLYFSVAGARKMRLESAQMVVETALVANTTLNVSGNTTLTGTLLSGLSAVTHGSTPYFDLKVGSTMKGRFYADASQSIIEAVGNNLILKSASTTAITIDSAQKVGIGRAPTQTLDVYRSSGNSDFWLETGGSNDDARAWIKRQSSSGRGMLTFLTQGGTSWYTGGLRYSNNYAIGNADDYGTNTRFVIDTSGNVGIGNTNPTETLSLSGDAVITGQVYLGGNDGNRRPFAKPSHWGYSSTYKAVVLGSTATNYNTNISGATTISFNYDPSGNSNGSFGGNGYEVLFRNGTAFYTPNAADDAWWSHMVSLQSGNVGLAGGYPPSYHTKARTLVVGRGSAGGITYFGGTNESWFAFARAAANNSDAYDGGISYNGDRDLKFHTNAGATRMTIDGSGAVGIGTTEPTSGVLLDVRGKIYVPSHAIQAGTALIGESGSHAMFGSNSTGEPIMISRDFSASYPDIVVDTSGKVGIGTASPSQKLEVNGGFKFNAFSAGHGLNVVSNQTFNNTDTANACGSLYYKTFIVNLYHNNGHSQIFGIANGGGGVGYPFTIIRPDTATAETGRPIDFSFTTIGSSPNTFRIQISSGGGALTVSRTSGTGSFGVQVHYIAGG